MKILITGGAGFIGTATGKRLRAMGHEVAVLDNYQERVHPDRNAIIEQTRKWANHIFYGDVRDDFLVTRAIGLFEPDAILHLAAYQDYQQDYHTFTDVNVTATAQMYEILRDMDWHGQVVVASSQSVLGDGAYECTNGLHKTTLRYTGQHRTWDRIAQGIFEVPCPMCQGPMQPAWTLEYEASPASMYGVSKFGEEQTCLVLGRIHAIPTVAFRYAIVQGAGQSPHNAYSGVLRAAALQLMAGRDEIMIFEDGEQQRDFIAIDDVVRANIVALQGEMETGEYNIGGDRAITVNEMVNTLCEIAGHGHGVRPGYARVGDVRHTLSDVGKVACWWKPQSIFEENVERYWRWLIEQPVDASKSVKALDNMIASGVLVKIPEASR